MLQCLALSKAHLRSGIFLFAGSLMAGACEAQPSGPAVRLLTGKELEAALIGKTFIYYEDLGDVAGESKPKRVSITFGKLYKFVQQVGLEKFEGKYRISNKQFCYSFTVSSEFCWYLYQEVSGRRIFRSPYPSGPLSVLGGGK